MRFAALGSGSRGNAWVVESGATRLLVDCGFGPREMVRRLARLGILPEQIDAVAVTHDHSDHVGGAAACARRFGWRLFMTRGTAAAAGHVPGDDRQQIQPGVPVAVGDLELHPFPVPHDAREPVQFVLSDGRCRLGILTDAGHVTPAMVAAVSGCEALVLECNHDLELLRGGRYPPALKRRIGGRWGHLDNGAAAGLLAMLDRSPLRHVVAAHLSDANNTPVLAQSALAAVLGCAPEWIAVATQESGLDWRDVK